MRWFFFCLGNSCTIISMNIISHIQNFFTWWYIIVVREYFQEKVSGRFVYLLNSTNTIPMAKNFGVPLFRDTSSFGKAISIFIRFWWIGFGSITSLVYTIPNFILGIILFALPFIPFIQLINFVLTKI